MNIDLEQTVELFSGERPFSLIALALGYKAFTVDKDAQASPDIVADVRQVSSDQLPRGPHLIWAAPPGWALIDPKSWVDDEPATQKAREAMEALMAAGSVMAATKPMWWFLETPARLPRQRPLLAGFNRG